MASDNTQPQRFNEHVQQHQRVRILDLMGTVDFRPDWDYKADRRLSNKRIPHGGYAVPLRQLKRMPRPGKK